MDVREKAAFYAVFNHIVLPPRVPNRQDPNLARIGHDILTRLIRATRSLEALPENPFTRASELLVRALQTCQTISEGGKLSASSLLGALRSLASNDILILHVTEQNAGLLIRRQAE
jgi:hypothetical protein